MLFPEDTMAKIWTAERLDAIHAIDRAADLYHQNVSKRVKIREVVMNDINEAHAEGVELARHSVY